MSELRIARSAGYCFGVERSVKIAEKALDEGGCSCLGELIHNRDAVAALEERGLRTVMSPAEVRAGERVVIRSHGVTKAAQELLEEKGVRIVDATCPFVKRIHGIVSRACEEGKLPVIIGF